MQTLNIEEGARYQMSYLNNRTTEHKIAEPEGVSKNCMEGEGAQIKVTELELSAKDM